MGLVELFTKNKILDVVKDPVVKKEIKKIAGSLDVLLDKVVGNKGSLEIRIELCQLLDIIKSGILDDGEVG